jgi:hypothetical protein
MKEVDAHLMFTRQPCGLVSDAAACSCNAQMPAALLDGRVRADGCDYAANVPSFQQARAVVRQVGETRRAFAVHRSSPPRGSSIDFARHLMETFESCKDSLVK